MEKEIERRKERERARKKEDIQSYMPISLFLASWIYFIFYE